MPRYERVVVDAACRSGSARLGRRRVGRPATALAGRLGDVGATDGAARGAPPTAGGDDRGDRGHRGRVTAGAEAGARAPASARRRREARREAGGGGDGAGGGDDGAGGGGAPRPARTRRRQRRDAAGADRGRAAAARPAAGAAGVAPTLDASSGRRRSC